MDRLEDPTGDETDARAIPPTVDADRETYLHEMTKDFEPREFAELSRLRAAMGFIPPHEAIPQVIDGRYTIVRTIGSGGMGIVYLAEDMNLENTPVALKVASEDFMRDVPTAQLKLRREAHQMLPLRGHPHVVMLLDAGVDAGRTYLIMEYVAGTDLRHWWRSESRTRLQILHVYLGAARGLRAAHDVGLVHRDFKPDNVLIGAGDIAKVTDFGIAGLSDEYLDTEVGPISSTEFTSMRGGTEGYMPPEQLGGGRPDARSDQFCFCVALWEALTGELPYKYEWRNVESQKQALRRPPKREQQVPWWLRRALKKGMSEQRGDRHRDMATLIEVLERGIARPRKLVRASLITLAVLVGGAVGAWWANKPMPEPPPPAPTCELLAASVSAHWGSERSEALTRRGETLNVDVSWTVAKLDELSESWSRAAEDTCVGDQALPVEDPGRRCLDDWLVSFDQAIELLAERGDQQTLANAPELLASIDPPNGDFCASNLARLPQDPELAALVKEARAAAVLGDRDRAQSFSRLAIERAQKLAGELPYSSELAHAHAARAYVLKLAKDIEGASKEFAAAEEHAVGANDLDTLLYVRVMWAHLFALAVQGEPARAAERQLELTQPLLYATAVAEDALIRGELLETRALIDSGFGRMDEAREGYTAAVAFYDRIGNQILAARAMIGRGIVELEKGEFASAEDDLRRAIAQLESEHVPADYPRLLDAAFNLAIVLFERSFEVDDATANRYAGESLDLLERVIAQASPPRRLRILGAACQMAAQTPYRERLRALTDQALAGLRAGEAAEDRDTVEAQVALAMMIGLDDAQAEARVRELLVRTPPLSLSLRSAVAQALIEYLERVGRCDEARRAFDELSGFEELAEFREWALYRPGAACK